MKGKKKMKNKRKNETHTERANGRLRVQIDCSRGGRTDQTQRDRCNINTIMAKAQMTGMLPNMDRQAQAQYGDFSNAEDYQTMCNKVVQAKEQFLNLPSNIRNRFNNDPAQLIGFLNDPTNDAEAITLKLRKAPNLPKQPIRVPADPKTDPADPE